MSRRAIFTKIKKLESLVLNSKDIGEPGDYFMNELIDDPDFAQTGRHKRNPKVVNMVSYCMEQFLKRDRMLITIPVILYVKPYAFYHGAYHVDELFGTFFYFDGHDKGMVVLSKHGKGADYFRLSTHVVPMPENAIPIKPNPAYTD